VRTSSAQSHVDSSESVTQQRARVHAMRGCVRHALRQPVGGGRPRGQAGACIAGSQAARPSKGYGEASANSMLSGDGEIWP
jgi:hypothetical protein